MMPKDYNLDWAISPVTSEEFFGDYFEKKHLLVKRGDSGFYGDLLSFAQIDHVVSTMGLYGPEITVTKSDPSAAASTGHGSDADSDAAPTPAPATDTDSNDGHHGGHGHRPITPGDYSYESGYIDPVRVAQLFADGATVILSGLQERLPKLANFSRALEGSLSCRVQTNIYMTPAGNQGFRPHYDSHDVIVLQIEGTKEWRIYDTPIELPLISQGFKPGAVPIGAEVDRFVLEPGDMLYVPRGMTHDAVATDETSLHITTGLMVQTWADLMAEAVNVIAHKHAAFRHALPPGHSKPDFDPAPHEATFSDLLTLLSEQAPFASLLGGFKDNFVANRVPRVEGQLAQVGKLAGLTPASVVGVRPHLVYDLALLGADDGKDQMISLKCYGSEITLPARVEVPLRHALNSASFAVSDLPGDLDDAGKVVLVKRLVREGLMVVQ